MLLAKSFVGRCNNQRKDQRRSSVLLARFEDQVICDIRYFLVMIAECCKGC
jgi:hypothetical protein